jgi:hypothetical protein
MPGVGKKGVRRDLRYRYIYTPDTVQRYED